MSRTNDAPLVVLTLRVPAEHATAVRTYAETLARATRIRVSPSAAGAAVLEAGLVALGLIEASERTPVASVTSKRTAPTAKKGAKRKARKP
jgi:hypothetical protein